MRLPAPVAAAGWLIAVALAGWAGWTGVRHWTAAELVAPQDLPADVRAEVDGAWTDFLAVFGSRRHCFDDVSLVLVAAVDGGDARYLPAEARIEIEIPTSPRRFRDSLIHELAHHVEHTCPAFAALRAELIAILGPDDPPWSDEADPWAERPSELWAETAVELVAGERVRTGRTVELPDGWTAAVARWATGG